MTVPNGLAATVTVNATANIFGAGHTVPPAPAGFGGGVLPPSIALDSSDSVMFPTISGAVSYSDGTLSAYAAPFSAEGSSAFGTTISGYGGISGISGNGFLWLVGVFLGGNEPANPSPTAFPAFTAGTKQFTNIAPALGQVFFIGDGRQGGARQLFKAPSGATRLFLGFADGDGGTGLPGYYQDNHGSLSVTYCLNPRLSVRPAGTNTIITWVNSPCDFYLERSTSLNPGSIWGTNGVTPFLSGDIMTVTNTVPTNYAEFFRLRAR